MNHKQKERWSLIGGIAGLVVGAWMIFYIKTNAGFVPAVMGTLLLLYRGRE